MKYEKIQALKVPVEDGFNVLIVPDECLGHFCHTFYLLHAEHGKTIEMFGTPEETEEQLVQIAIANAPDYIRQYLADLDE